MCVVAILAVLAVVRMDATDDAPPTFFPLQSKWLVDLGQRPAAAPAHDEALVFVPLRDGTLVAVAMADGSIAWTSDFRTGFTPAVDDGLVVVATDEELVGLRTVDARMVWSVDLGSPVSVAPMLTTGWLVVALESGELVVLRAADGAEFWREQLSGSVDVQPSVGGSTLFVPVSDGWIVAFELATGQRFWEFQLKGRPQRILALESLFVGSTDNFFYRLSRQNGRIQWRVRTGGDIVGLPAVDAERVFFVSLDNVLRALDRDSGVQRWRRALRGRPMAGPQVVDDMVLVSGVAPQLRAFDTETGDPRGVLEAPAEFAVAPHVIREPALLTPGLVVTTGDGRLQVMGRPTGPRQFSLSFPPWPVLPEPERFAPADVLPFVPFAPLPTQLVPADVLPFWPVDLAPLAIGDPPATPAPEVSESLVSSPLRP